MNAVTNPRRGHTVIEMFLIDSEHPHIVIEMFLIDSEHPHTTVQVFLTDSESPHTTVQVSPESIEQGRQTEVRYFQTDGTARGSGRSFQSAMYETTRS